MPPTSHRPRLRSPSEKSMGSFASKLDGIVLLGRIIPIKLISSLRPMWCLHNLMVILPRQWTVPLLPEFLYGPYAASSESSVVERKERQFGSQGRDRHRTYRIRYGSNYGCTDVLGLRTARYGAILGRHELLPLAEHAERHHRIRPYTPYRTDEIRAWDGSDDGVSVRHDTDDVPYRTSKTSHCNVMKGPLERQCRESVSQMCLIAQTSVMTRNHAFRRKQSHRLFTGAQYRSIMFPPALGNSTHTPFFSVENAPEWMTARGYVLFNDYDPAAPISFDFRNATVRQLRDYQTQRALSFRSITQRIGFAKVLSILGCDTRKNSGAAHAIDPTHFSPTVLGLPVWPAAQLRLVQCLAIFQVHLTPLHILVQPPCIVSVLGILSGPTLLISLHGLTLLHPRVQVLPGPRVTVRTQTLEANQPLHPRVRNLARTLSTVLNPSDLNLCHPVFQRRWPRSYLKMCHPHRELSPQLRSLCNVSASGSRKKSKKAKSDRPPVAITHELYVDRLERVMSVGSTWTVPRDRTAYKLVDLSATPDVLKEGNKTRTIDAYIKAEDQDAWEGSTGHVAGDVWVTSAFNGEGKHVRAQRAQLTCKGVNVCEYTSEEIFGDCERYEPDSDAMQDLWIHELDANEREAASPEAILSRFYVRVIQSKCKIPCDGVPVLIQRSHGPNAYGQLYFVGCSSWKPSERWSHLYHHIPVNVDEDEFRYVFENDGRLPHGAAQNFNEKCVLTTHPRLALKRCCFTHVVDGVILPAKLLPRKCDTELVALIPVRPFPGKNWYPPHPPSPVPAPCPPPSGPPRAHQAKQAAAARRVSMTQYTVCPAHIADTMR
ncbi:hypothetical protein FB45DRAFT_1140840 [Roridomyces roridus]|uniref:Uncharacterized protein n=1 Tax=Roridomyces roridus TaxID=1738132 RepID=A0AAD7AZN6_9AGAR|nr:hypothetical protein FB45DRAFT_1140840 [Roridomyces roridus]